MAPDADPVHMHVQWRSDVEAAARTERPILLGLVAGDLLDSCRIGGALRRDGALSDEEVIALITARFVPVWVNIREEPVPDLRALDPALEGIALDERRRVTGGFTRSFFLRRVVLTPDGGRLLNPQGAPSLGRLFGRGHFAYAQGKADDYRAMLEGALQAYGR